MVSRALRLRSGYGADPPGHVIKLLPTGARKASGRPPGRVAALRYPAATSAVLLACPLVRPSAAGAAAVPSVPSSISRITPYW